MEKDTISIIIQCYFEISILQHWSGVCFESLAHSRAVVIVCKALALEESFHFREFFY